MSFDGNNEFILDVAAVLRVVEPLVGVVPVDITAGLDTRREMDVVRLIDAAVWVIGVFIAVLPAVRVPVAAFDPETALPMPETALRTMAIFDVAAAGRSTLFGRDVFNRDVMAGEATPVFVAIRPMPILPRLARRFTVDSDGRAAKIKFNPHK